MPIANHTAHSSAYSLGIFFIVLVALIWTASSILVQYLYSDDVSFDSPFLLTYIGVSLFSLWLPTHQAWTALYSSRSSSFHMPVVGVEMSTTPYEAVHTEGSRSSSHDSSDASQTEQDNAGNRIRVHAMQVWTKAEHQQAARMIAPVWFLANWAYNASLEYTTITSSTVLASTGSLFTFIFAVCFKDEKFNWIKCSGVLLGVFGSILTAFQDRNSDNEDSSRPSTAFWGDCLGLVSAVGYGAYAVQTRLLCPHDESLYSMQILLGYIGLYNMVVLSPIAVYAYLNSKSNLSSLVLCFVIVKGLFDNVLSDYLWLRAIMLTSATVATVGLGLTIPLAFASDILLQRSDVLTMISIIGAMSVLGGFVIVNIGNDEESDHPSSVASARNESDTSFRDADSAEAGDVDEDISV